MSEQRNHRNGGSDKPAPDTMDGVMNGNGTNQNGAATTSNQQIILHQTDFADDEELSAEALKLYEGFLQLDPEEKRELSQRIDEYLRARQDENEKN